MGRVRFGSLATQRTTSLGGHKEMVPGLQDLLQNIKALEDYLRACRSGEPEQAFSITPEEMEVVRSFRRFMAREDEYLA